MPNVSTWMMIDGKLNPHALPSLYANNMATEVIALLLGTTYAPIAASGPLLARVEDHNKVLACWQDNEPPTQHAWCFTSDLTTYELAAHWRRRLLLRGPMDRTLWLRYADARVIARGLERQAFPRGFWHATASLQLNANHGGYSLLPEPDWDEPGKAALVPCFTLSEQQLTLLSPEPQLQERSS